jgi:hypothetical protein
VLDVGEVEQFVNRPLVVYVLALASTLPWRVLHRIAFPVVSEWCQESVDYVSLVPLQCTRLLSLYPLRYAPSNCRGCSS